MSICTNCALLVCLYDAEGNWKIEPGLAAILVIEHILLLIKFGFSRVVPEEPAWVRANRMKNVTHAQDVCSKQLLRCASEKESSTKQRAQVVKKKVVDSSSNALKGQFNPVESKAYALRLDQQKGRAREPLKGLETRGSKRSCPLEYNLVKQLKLIRGLRNMKWPQTNL
ncbi:hypothetical protein Ancab_029706 [Ancistrocladus abbreviatus]